MRAWLVHSSSERRPHPCFLLRAERTDRYLTTTVPLRWGEAVSHRPSGDRATLSRESNHKRTIPSCWESWILACPFFPAALKAAGLDTTAPTAGLAEGLLIYLPPEAQDRLFDNITALSAPGSTVATEFVPGIIDFDPDRASQMATTFRDHGVDIDMGSLVYTGQRNHVVDYLKGNGWDAEGVTRAELFQRNGIDVPAAEDDDPLGEIIFISGSLAG